MASVIVKLAGGRPKELSGVTTVADVRREMDVGADFRATVNGEPVQSGQERATKLVDNQLILFTANVKGGASVIVKLAGGRPKELSGVTTVADVRREMDVGADFRATVNGEPVQSGQERATTLVDNQLILFTANVKGGFIAKLKAMLS